MSKQVVKTSPQFARKLVLSLGAITMLFAPMSAKSQESYKKHFSAYQSAHTSGDMATARAEAEAAWKAAEEALGDNKLTGILAYNYGSLMILHDQGKAVKPLKRAKKLVKAGVSDLPQDVIDAYLAYASYSKTPSGKTAVKLRQSLTPLLGPNAVPELDDTFMWLNMAMRESKQMRLWHAGPAAHNVVLAIEARNLEDASRPALNNALIIRAAAGLSGRERTPPRIAIALNDLDRLINSFGTQKDAHAVDPVLSTALAWKAVALQELKDQGEPSPIPSKTPSLEAVFMSHAGRPVDCKVNWAKQTEANFLSSGVFPGYVGAALISYDITRSGKIENAKLLTQVPNVLLGSEAMRTFKKWELATPPVDHAGCRKNQIASFVYHAEWPPL